MFTNHLRNVSISTACLITLAPWGCRTDSLWESRHSPNAPVVASAANPPRTRAAQESLDVTIADAQEVDLVESVLANRAKYHRGLEQLRLYYETRGYTTKQGWAAFELEGLKSVKAFRYLTDAEVPATVLRPSESIPEANAMYDKALELMRQGGHGVPVLYRREPMIKAATLFRELVERFPTSDKIDDAAFMCGEIHKEYLPDQELIAVKWYERAWTWNPEIPHPARFQAAVIYDYRLHDRDRALELYRESIEHEMAIQSNVRYATRRIGELTEGSKMDSVASPVATAPEPR